MRLAIAFAFALAATAGSHRGCGKGGAAYDPCAGKTCGEQCRACAPDDPDCVETMEVKACDLQHHCVSSWGGLCDPAKVDCRGSTCGAVCTIDPPCRSATPPCMMPSQLGHCDPTGTCIPGTPPPDFCPPWGCAGKACGDSCGYCPPGTDPSRCPVPTFAPLACDALLRCNTVGTFTCPAGPP